MRHRNRTKEAKGKRRQRRISTKNQEDKKEKRTGEKRNSKASEAGKVKEEIEEGKTQ